MLLLNITTIEKIKTLVINNENALENNLINLSTSFFSESKKRVPKEKNFFYDKDSDKFKEEGFLKPFSFIVSLSSFQSNVLAQIGDTKGKIILSHSTSKLSSALGYNKHSTTSVSKLLHFLKDNAKFISKQDLIEVHLHDFNEYFNVFILNLLSESFNIIGVLLTNNNPHNGCRPQKIVVRKKVKFTIKKYNKK